MVNKNQIRAEMKRFLTALSTEAIHGRSLAACEMAAGTRAFHDANTIMLYLSMAGEPETSALALRAWKEGKSVAVPQVQWETRRMQPLEITSLDTAIRTTPAGMREPVSGRVIPLDMIDVVMIPGLAFDRRGYRVGRGKGFYDRFLAQKDFRGIRAGVCFDEQLLNTDIPFEPHDIPMDLIITDRETLLCAGSDCRK